jgi:hypothetical protein
MNPSASCGVTPSQTLASTVMPRVKGESVVNAPFLPLTRM